MTDDTTTARRTLLALLLDRVERGVLLPAEAPLIRPLVAAEQDAVDARPTTRITFHDDATSAAVRPLLRDIDMFRRTQATLMDRASVAEATVYRLRQAVREARAAALPHSELDSFVQQMTAILDGPSPTPDDTPPPGLLGTVTDWATSIDEQCPAHYKGEPPQLTQPAWESVDYRCERRGHGLDSDHAVRLAQGSGTVAFCWADAIAVYPSTDAPSDTEAETGVVCSPLVNPACPGHTGDDRCERAASSPAPAAALIEETETP